ncbi:MAG: hypothetical protein ISR65_20165 [Bacteriovoracaceae bacterium]|nr:hypothetical protein [Bacteroidota bacterium]MBL6992110.1 hypothetical protein [Bacteriovoracaceae bacterium]
MSQLQCKPPKKLTLPKGRVFLLPFDEIKMPGDLISSINIFSGVELQMLKKTISKDGWICNNTVNQNTHNGVILAGFHKKLLKAI